MGRSGSGKINSRAPAKVAAVAKTPEKPVDLQLVFTQLKAIIDRFAIKTCKECEKSFNTTKRPVQTLCGHIKCGDCFLENEDDCRQCNTQMTVRGEKPVSCRRCRQLFPSLEVLQQHMTTHSGERPFECSECEKTFRKEIHAIRHIKMIHNYPNDGSYKQVAEAEEVEE